MLTVGRTVATMRRNQTALQAMLHGVSQAEALAKTDGPDGWCPVEIVCHLRDFEEICFRRARLALEQDRPALPPMPHEAWVIEHDYKGQDLREMLTALVNERAAFTGWLLARTPEELGRAGIHPEVGEMQIIEMSLQAVFHDADHLEQLSRTLGKSERVLALD